jgi:hypothetical protein
MLVLSHGNQKTKHAAQACLKVGSTGCSTKARFDCA